MAIFSKTAVTKAALVVTATTVALGGVQFVRASDTIVPGDASLRTAPAAVAVMVNRQAKADRNALANAILPSQILSFHLSGLDDTTVVMRFAQQEAAMRQQSINGAKAQPARDPAARPKKLIACELVVSPLTEVAKSLGPGRCLT